MVHKPETYLIDTHQREKDSEHNMAVMKSEERKEKEQKNYGTARQTIN